MRLLRSSCVVAVLIGLAIAGSRGLPPLNGGEPSDLFTANSVWQGTCEQSQPKASYPMILFVKQRQGDTFEGMTWYPTLGNGLLKVSGRIDPKGTVTFTEDKLIHGEVHDGNMIVVAGAKFTAKLGRTALRGSGEYVDPKTRETSALKIALRLAE